MASGPVALELRSLGKRYGNRWALRQLDLDVRAGEVVGYLGPNGAGKTTTIRLILDLARPTTGRARVFGIDSHGDPVGAHRRLAYIPAESGLWPELTGAETLELFSRLQPATDPAYRDRLVERFALDPSRRVRHYSRGNRQKLLVVAGLMSRAPILLLDEPSSGLDPLMEAEFRECIREARDRGQAVLLSSHLLSEVEAVCDRVAILREGRLVESGTLAELRHLSALSVEATFSGPAPDLGGVPGVSDVWTGDHRFTCRVHGPVQPLLARLSSTEVQTLLCREPSLEELFMTEYGLAPDGSRSP